MDGGYDVLATVRRKGTSRRDVARHGADNGSGRVTVTEGANGAYSAESYTTVLFEHGVQVGRLYCAS